MTRAVHLAITGRVHGVGYRAWLAEQATRHGLAGWVRNRPDGSVEAVLSGEVGAIDTMTAQCQAGPTAARVSDVVSEAYEGEPITGFTILPTG